MSHSHLLQLDFQSLHFPFECFFLFFDQFFADISRAWAEAEYTEAHVFYFFDAEVISDFPVLLVALYMISDEFMLCLHIGLFRLMKALFIDQRWAWDASELRLHVFVGWMVGENALTQSAVSELQITALQSIKKLLNILDILLVFVIELDGLLTVLILDEIIMLTAKQILDGMLFEY